MSVALRAPMALSDFLLWEEAQDARYEFDGFHPVAMTGGTAEHAFIQANLIRSLGNRLGRGPCRVVGSELKVAVAGAVRYPDAFVVCTPVPRGATLITDPVVVFEILSASTSYRDRIEKNREYRMTQSIQRYVILEQTRPAATVYTRAGDDWLADVLLADAPLTMPEIGVTVPLAELYDGIDVPPADADPEQA